MREHQPSSRSIDSDGSDYADLSHSIRREPSVDRLAAEACARPWRDPTRPEIVTRPQWARRKLSDWHVPKCEAQVRLDQLSASRTRRSGGRCSVCGAAGKTDRNSGLRSNCLATSCSDGQCSPERLTTP